MNDEEIGGIADGMFKYLKSQCEPVDALLVIITLLVMYYDQAKRRDADYSIEEFSASVAKDATDLYRRVITRETLQ